MVTKAQPMWWKREIGLDGEDAWLFRMSDWSDIPPESVPAPEGAREHGRDYRKPGYNGSGVNGALMGIWFCAPHGWVPPDDGSIVNPEASWDWRA